MTTLGDGAVFLENPAFQQKPSYAIVKTFYDRLGNVVSSTDPSNAYGGFYEFKPGAAAQEQLQNSITNITNNYSNDLSGVNGRLDSIEALLKAKAENHVEAVRNEIVRTIQIGERSINTNAVPVLGALESVTSGAMGFDRLDDATTLAIMSSIPWALQFIQAQSTSRVHDALGVVNESLLTLPSSIVQGVGDALGGLGQGLLDGIAAIMHKIESLILDPLAMLLAGILDAIERLPRRIADAAWDSLLEDRPAQPEAA